MANKKIHKEKDGKIERGKSLGESTAVEVEGKKSADGLAAGSRRIFYRVTV